MGRRLRNVKYKLACPKIWRAVGRWDGTACNTVDTVFEDGARVGWRWEGGYCYSTGVAGPSFFSVFPAPPADMGVDFAAPTRGASHEHRNILGYLGPSASMPACTRRG
ncbi:hypothetical protein KM043_010816 [Ampulex compressa]|nr:hypothetical protein KM043_010816 [Ampulex compressa]